jgi:large subunit ribosomal protein L35
VPKMKTRKALIGRFRLTATGKLKRSHPGRRHIMTKKTTKRKRHLRQPGLVSTAHLATYKRVMGIG